MTSNSRHSQTNPIELLIDLRFEDFNELVQIPWRSVITFDLGAVFSVGPLKAFGPSVMTSEAVWEAGSICHLTKNGSLPLK